MHNIITQTCVTVQGEGKKVGVPSLIVRFGLCNLHCDFCDTKWSCDPAKIKAKPFDNSCELPAKIENRDQAKRFSIWMKNKYFDHFRIKNLMVTGGEPLINADSAFDIIEPIKGQNPFFETFEMETNGLLIDKDILHNYYPDFHFNISPKLEPSAHNDKLSVSDIIDRYGCIDGLLRYHNANYTYKFVYSESMKHTIRRFIAELGVPAEKVLIMPLTPDRFSYNCGTSTIDEYNFLMDFRKSCQDAVKFCLEFGYDFSPREHIWVFGKELNELDDILKKDTDRNINQL